MHFFMFDLHETLMPLNVRFVAFLSLHSYFQCNQFTFMGVYVKNVGKTEIETNTRGATT